MDEFATTGVPYILEPLSSPGQRYYAIMESTMPDRDMYSPRIAPQDTSRLPKSSNQLNGSLIIIHVLLQVNSETLSMGLLHPAASALITSCLSGNATTSIWKQVVLHGSIFGRLGHFLGSRQNSLRLMWKGKPAIRPIVPELTLTFAVVVICSAFVGGFRSFCSTAS